MPFLLNLRWNAMIAPNEEPKWFVLVVLGLVLAVAGSYETHLACRDKPTSKPRPGPSGLSLPGLFFLLFFIGLALGVTYAANPDEGVNRLAFWCAGGLTLWATAWASGHEPRFIHYLQCALSISAFMLCAHFWYGFLVDFRHSDFNKFVQFSRIGHFNFTADVLMVLIPLLVWTLLTHTMAWVKMLSGFSLATTLFMLVTSGSLGGMGGLLAGATLTGGLGLLGWMGKRRGAFSLPGKRTLLLGLAILSIMLLLARLVFDLTPKEYKDQIFTRGVWWNAPKTQDFAKAKTLPPLAPLWMAITPYLGSRTPMWAATSGMVAERPWLGFGTGSYLYEYPGFSKRYDLFGDYETLGIRIKTNPHNILLQLAAENGLPLTLLFVGLYLWLMVKVMRQAWQEPKAFWLCATWALWATALDAQVNHVFFNPASLFMAAVGMGLWYGQLSKKAGNRSLSLCPLWRSPISALLVSLMALAIASYPLRWVVSQYFVAEAGRLATADPPASPRKVVMAWSSALKWGPNNPSGLYGLAGFYLQHHQPAQAEDTLLEFLKLSPNHSAGLNHLATLQANAGRLDEAEKTFTEVLRLEPDATIARQNLEELLKSRHQGSTKAGNERPAEKTEH
jgi:tetratricopeptide (TPR) repeat protein